MTYFSVVVHIWARLVRRNRRHNHNIYLLLLAWKQKWLLQVRLLLPPSYINMTTVNIAWTMSFTVFSYTRSTMAFSPPLLLY